MARKKAAPAPPPPNRERVGELTRLGDFSRAFAAAKDLHRLSPSLENLDLLKSTIAAAASFYAERDQVIEFTRFMDEADRTDPADAGWAAARACLLAKGGRLQDALMRADDTTRPRVFAHAADRALRTASKEFLPDELHAGFDAIAAAFKKYEIGHDNSVRDLLEPVGLRSPFLEWKVLLRGLMAHATADDTRAVENFARLDADRLPAKLAAPYRAAIDAKWKTTLPVASVDSLHKQYQRLNSSPLAGKLRDLARHLGRDKPMQPAFRAIESLRPQLKQQRPELIARLANCFYHAIFQQGEPDDLPRYRRVFGNPPDDPGFFKLQAVICEHNEAYEQVHDFWRKYDVWLATKPPGWPANQLARARAAIWLRLGRNAMKADAQRHIELPASPFDLLFPDVRKRLKPLDPPALSCFRQAGSLAPDWPDAVLELINSLLDEERSTEAEAVLRELLTHHPENLKGLNSLGNLLQGSGRAAEAAEVFLRAAAINPLDPGIRREAAHGVLAQARSLLAGSSKECLAVLERHAALLHQVVPAERAALIAVAETKRGNADAAADARTRATSNPGTRLAVAYRIMIDSQLAKLKPKDKKVAEARFAEELEQGNPLPREVAMLLGAYDQYLQQGISYRGQKAHEKKLLAQVDRCRNENAPVDDFEDLSLRIRSRGSWKLLKKLTDHCIDRFPRNPAFYLYRSEAGLNSNERDDTVERRLLQARRIAEAATEPRFRELIPRIDALLDRHY